MMVTAPVRFAYNRTGRVARGAAWCDPVRITGMAESDGRRTRSVRLPPELDDAIVEAARRDRRSVSNWLELAAAEKLERDKQDEEG